MAELIPVEDPGDPRLGEFASLTDVALRRRREPAEGLFVAEGEKVIRRALRAGYPMRSMLLSAKWLDVMRDVIDSAGAPVYLVRPEVAEQVTGYHVHRGALASMGRTPLPPVDALLGAAPAAPEAQQASAHHRAGPPSAGGVPDEYGPRRIAVLEDIVDHANVGAAFRSAAALGVDAVLITPRCADPLYRRAVKVSMGAVFQVPWTRLTRWPEEIGRLREAGYVTAALALGEDSVPLEEFAARRPPRLALVLGTEGEGLAPSTLAAADVSVTIPMAAGVDSLNVAAAAAVAFYATGPAAGVPGAR